MDFTCIKFTDKVKIESSIPFLDALITCKEDGSVKIQVCQKNTYTVQ